MNCTTLFIQQTVANINIKVHIKTNTLDAFQVSLTRYLQQTVTNINIKVHIKTKTLDAFQVSLVRYLPIPRVVGK